MWYAVTKFFKSFRAKQSHSYFFFYVIILCFLNGCLRDSSKTSHSLELNKIDQFIENGNYKTAFHLIKEIDEHRCRLDCESAVRQSRLKLDKLIATQMEQRLKEAKKAQENSQLELALAICFELIHGYPNNAVKEQAKKLHNEIRDNLNKLQERAKQIEE